MGGKVIHDVPLDPKYDFLNFNVSKLTFLVKDITEISEKWAKIWKNWRQRVLAAEPVAFIISIFIFVEKFSTGCLRIALALHVVDGPFGPLP